NAFTTGRMWLVENSDELEEAYKRAASLVPAETILVQQFVPSGPDNQFSFAALCSDGTVRASVVAQRARTHPDEFGVATYVRTVPELSGTVGVSWRHFIPDAQRALIDARNGSGIRQYVRTFTSKSEGAVAASDDPIPGLAEPALLTLSRIRSKRRSSSAARTK